MAKGRLFRVIATPAETTKPGATMMTKASLSPVEILSLSDLAGTVVARLQGGHARAKAGRQTQCERSAALPTQGDEPRGRLYFDDISSIVGITLSDLLTSGVRLHLMTPTCLP